MIRNSGNRLSLRQNAEGNCAEIMLIKEHGKAYDFSAALNLKFAARGSVLGKRVKTKSRCRRSDSIGTERA
jgi:hypothetical protein